MSDMSENRVVHVNVNAGGGDLKVYQSSRSRRIAQISGFGTRRDSVTPSAVNSKVGAVHISVPTI